MNKEEFKALVKEHLNVIESYKIDKNGTTKMKIYGVEKLYKAINFTHSSLTLLTREELITNSIILKLKNHLESAFDWILTWIVPILYCLLAIGLLLNLFRMLYILFWG